MDGDRRSDGRYLGIGAFSAKFPHQKIGTMAAALDQKLGDLVASARR
jgi:hypothetical protein